MLVIPARLSHLFPKGACDQLASGRRAGAPRLQEQGKRETPAGMRKKQGGSREKGIRAPGVTNMTLYTGQGLHRSPILGPGLRARQTPGGGNV